MQDFFFMTKKKYLTLIYYWTDVAGKKFLLQAVMTLFWHFHWGLSGKKTWGQHLSCLCPFSKEEEYVTMHATLAVDEK